MDQIVSVTLMIIGLVLIAPALITYVVLSRLETRYSPTELVEKIFKKKISNASARLDLLHIMLLAAMIIGLGLLLAGVVTGVATNVKS